MTYQREEKEMSQQEQVARFHEIMREVGQDRVKAARIAMREMGLSFDEVVDLSWAAAGGTAPRTEVDAQGYTYYPDDTYASGSGAGIYDE